MRDKNGRFIKGNHVISEFKIGHIPWHKGLKGICLNTGRTHFKKGENLGQDHWNWKGDHVGYAGVHSWIEKILGKPFYCMNCDLISTSKKFQWHNLSGKYKRDINDWVRLCTKCHHKIENIANRGWITRRLHV